MKKFYILFFVFLFFLRYNVKSQTIVFSAHFSTNKNATWTTSGAIGTSAWTIVRSGDDMGARRNTSPEQLELTNDASATTNANGWIYAYTNTTSFLSPYNTTLASNIGVITWTFNMRQIRADPAGMASGSYGVAYVLAGNNSNIASNGSGYAILLGNSGSTDPIRLVKFNNGLRGTVTDILSSNTSGYTDFGNHYLSIRVTFIPDTKTWGLALEKDNTTFLDPVSTLLADQGTTVDSTYTGISLTNMGAFWNAATTATQTSFFDNVRVAISPICTPPTTQASSIAVSNINSTTATIKWTSGSGNNRIVVVKAGSAVAGTPTSGTAYTASSTFGSGAIIATNEYVVYNGSDDSVDISGLSCTSIYHIKIFEYNGSDTCYLKTSPPSGNFTTLTPSLTQQTLPPLNTFTYLIGSGPSASQYREYSATNLAPSTGAVRVTSSNTARYEVSLDDIGFSNFVDINYTEGAFTNIPVYIRLKAGLTIGAFTENMTATVQSPPTLVCTKSVSQSLDGIINAAPCQELFISEYIEGLSFDKAIEIYNPTANPISLTNYYIRIYSNGSAASSYSANLAGTIPAYGTWVAANSSASAEILAIANQTFPQASFSFDGNDAIALEYNTTKLDIFGRIGENPSGGKWVSGTIETAEQTLVRKPTVQLGIGVNPSSGFPTLGTEWLQYDQSESTFLGSHFSTCKNENVIITNTISPTQYCVSASQGASVSVDFTSVGVFNSGNVFHAQLSNATGSFSSPIIIGSLSLSGTDVGGTINGIIPAATLAGNGYRIRVIATSPSGTLGSYMSPTKILVNVGPENPSVVTANSSGSGNVQLSWANPVCLDEMLVIMCTDAVVSTVPFGDGSNYNVTGSSECLVNACEQVIYKGVGTSITLNGLEDGRTYHFKVFTRMGTLWSSGVSSNATPNGATTIQPGDFAVIGVNANNDPCVSGTGDSIYFVCFKDINTGTVIDITDNGYERCNAGQFGNTEGFYRVTYVGSTIPAGKIITWYFPSSGVPTTLASNWNVTNLGSTSGFNFNSGGDQMFFLQGGVWDNGITNNHDATYTGGRYLFAFNTDLTWSASCSTSPTQRSNLPSQVSCYEQSPSSGVTNYFLYTGDKTVTDKFTWLQRLISTSNWTSYSTGNCAGFNSDINSNFPSRNILIDNTNPVASWTGASSTNWFDCNNWSSFLVPDANVNITIPNTTNKPVISASAPFSDQYHDIAAIKNITIQNGAIVTVEGSADNRLDIYGNLTIDLGGILDADDGSSATDDGTIRISGNWNNNNGTSGFLEGNSKVKFFGGNNQFIDINTGIESFNSIVIEKQRQTYVELSDNISVSNTGVLEFGCGGIIRTNTFKVSVLNPNRTAAIIGFDQPSTNGVYNNDRYVYGNLERNINTIGEYIYPIGDIHTGESYNSLRINIQSGTGMATAKFIAGNPGSINVPITNVVCSGQSKFIEYTGMTGQGWWNMNSSSGTTFTYDIYLHPNILNVNTFPNDNIGGYKNNYRALKATTGTGGGLWPIASGFDGDECIVSNNYYEIIGSGYSGFSDFAPAGGDGRTTALPVELLSFTSTCMDNEEVQLTWITASEVNSDYFVIEKSTDALNFVPLSTIAAQGFSTTNQIYNYSNLSNTTKVYYRLKQYDIDGKEHIFNTIYVDCSDDKSSINMYYAGNNTIKIDAQNKEGEYEFNLFQYDGKNIFSKQLNIETGKQIISIIPSQQLARGVYIIQLVNDKFVLAKKIHIE
ncbi:MAG: lamin tail domain-containing protein [Sphingobacteriales bacterium]|nr:MAG: lamin tail domain-containing protein [Sphingobacteriales bacterium]